MNKKLKYWIKERHNPQLGKPYYVLYGQLTIKDAMKFENSLYGYNIMLRYNTRELYEEKIKDLQDADMTIYSNQIILEN